jgi:hypothetical protein
METDQTWYAKKAGNDSQGLVIDEKTGRNVAVSYDMVNTAMLAAAPDMLAALSAMRGELDQLSGQWTERMDTLAQMADAAIDKARGAE